MTKHIVAVTLLLAGLLMARQNKQIANQAAQTPTSEPRKLALLIGINRYKYSDPKKGFYNLEGCINDIHRMKNLLIGKFGFKAGDIKMLADEEATHQNILDAIRSFLTNQARSDDVVVIHFSGHGSQASDPAKINQLAETIVPYDSRDPEGKVSDITGDELAKYVSELSAKTKFVTIILDSCHSGDLIGRGLRMGLARSIPPDVRKLPRNTDALGQRSIESFRSPNATFAFIAAARSDETAKEYTIHGSSYGALTYFFTQEVSPAGSQQTYRDVIGPIATDVNSVYPDQHVTLAGINKDAAVFSDTSILSQPFIETLAGHNGKVILQAGAIQGVSAGSVYKVYPPQTKSFFSVSPVTSVTIDSVNSFDSTATITKDVPIASSSRAVETLHMYADQKVNIFFQAPEKSDILQSVQRKLATESNLTVSTDPLGCRFRVVDEQSKIVLYAADAKTILSSLAKSPSIQEDVLNDIGLWVKWYNLMAINNEQPGIQLKVSILQDHPTDNSESGGVIVHPNDKFRLKFENPSGQGLYLAVLNLSDNGKVATIYQSINSALPPAGTFTTYEFQASTLPSGRTSTKDVLKIFATDQPVDFSFLNQNATVGTQKGLRPRGAESPLGQLMAQAGLGFKRDINAVPSDWVTTSFTITTQSPAP